MKRALGLFFIVMSSILIMAPFAAYAKGDQDASPGQGPEWSFRSKDAGDAFSKESGATPPKTTDAPKDKGLTPAEAVTDSTETALQAYRLQRDETERELLHLRTALNNLAAGDAAAQAVLRRQIAEKEALMDALQAQIIQKKKTLKDMLRNLYSQEEWAAAARLQQQLDRRPGTQSLPVNSVMVYGKAVKLDTPPVIIAGHTLIPARAIGGALGAEVRWNEAAQRITVQKGETVVAFVIGSDTMTVNGSSVALETPSLVINGRTLIPLRALSESLNLGTSWDDVLQIIEIQ